MTVPVPERSSCSQSLIVTRQQFDKSPTKGLGIASKPDNNGCIIYSQISTINLTMTSSFLVLYMPSSMIVSSLFCNSQHYYWKRKWCNDMLLALCWSDKTPILCIEIYSPPYETSRIQRRWMCRKLFWQLSNSVLKQLFSFLSKKSILLQANIRLT